ncbi:glycosyltransferase [candidate division KSB1 bacterium]|nr:glycosyltransferase [candidate division KSB1 bacterium]
MLDYLLLFGVLAILSLYALQTLLFWVGLRRGQSKASEPQLVEPVVSIVVAARNEEQHLPHLLESFRHLNYPPEKTEILIVDDHSQDYTRQIAQNFAQGDARFYLLSAQEPSQNLNGKANAIDTAIAAARGEIIVITDADCRIPPDWLRAHLKYYSKSIAMVGGFVLPENCNSAHHLFASLQALDWLYLCAVGAGGAGRGRALSIFGNNFSFRKSAYLQVGGFAGAGFSVIEDFALMRAMQRANHNIALAADPDMLVRTEPALSVREFYHQRKRWVLGGRGISLAGLYALSLSFISKIVPLFVLFWADIDAFLLVFAWLAVADFLLACSAARQIRYFKPLKVAPLHFFFAMAYSIAFAPIFFLAKSVVWKGRRYKT